MTSYQSIIDQLDALTIPYEIVNHPPAHTTEEADAFIEGKEGVRTKSLFLTTKKKNAYYLIIMDDSKRLDMDKFRDLAQTPRLRLGPPELIQEKLGSQPGVVCPFDLINNTDQDVQLYFDRAILAEPIQTFHPGDNTKTIFLSTDDLFKFLDAIDYPYQIIDL